MLSVDNLTRLQQEQYKHDRRNHTDILCLPKPDRIKHYGLHFCKYAGRLSRGSDDPKGFDRTVVDTFLVCLSAANTLHQKLESAVSPYLLSPHKQVDLVYTFVDAAGRFADACEKMDHLEEFHSMAHKANADIAGWVISVSADRQFSLDTAIGGRRAELAQRHFYISD